MYEARLEANADINVSALKNSTIVLPIKFDAANDQNEKNKMKANFERIQRTFKKLVIVPTDLLQVDRLKAEHSEKSDQELLLEAFNLGVAWLKSVAALILKINILVEIIPWHQMIYDDFSNEKVHELFVKDGSLKNTLANIEAWSIRVTEKLQHAGSLTPNQDYLNYLDKVKALNSDDKAFTGSVITSINFFKERANKRKKAAATISNKNENCNSIENTIIAEQNSKDNIKDEGYRDYVLKESAVYWMWGEQESFKCSAYPADLNPAIQHIQEKFLDEKLFHLKIKYQSVKKIILDDDSAPTKQRLPTRKQQSFSAPSRLEGGSRYEGSHVIEKKSKSQHTSPRNSSPEKVLRTFGNQSFWSNANENQFH